MRFSCRLVYGGPLLLMVGSILIPFGLPAAPVKAQETPAAVAVEFPVPPGIQLSRNIIYHSVDKTNLELDLACPPGNGPFPALLVIHGIGPLNEGRLRMVPWIIEAAQRGYVAIAISYRCKPEDGFAAPIQDAKGAVCWLRSNAAKYAINPDQIAALGFSGGGSIACILGMATPKDGLEGPWEKEKHSTRVQAVISYFPPTDWSQLHSYCCKKAKDQSWHLGVQKHWVKSLMEKALGGPPANAADNYTRASPITYARKGAAPLLLIHGSDDTVVPVDQSQRLRQKMLEVGAAVHFVTFDQAPHDFDGGTDANARLAAAATWAYLEHHLKKGKEVALKVLAN